MAISSLHTENIDPDLAADSAISQTAAIEYWSKVSADNEGMLGGYPHVSRIDLRSSSAFIVKLLRRRRAAQVTQQPSASHIASSKPELFSRAVDCGAGIGRITAGLLVNVAKVVDVVEPVAKFTAEISEGESFAALRQEGKIGDVYTIGLEAWVAEHTYDLVWNQWCLGQLNDSQLVDYLVRCKDWLAYDGWIVVKENMSTDPWGQDIFDETDSSVTRSDEKFRTLFERAGLKIVLTEEQKGFPKDLFPVRTYALQPKES